jgi:hypothetical protein
LSGFVTARVAAGRGMAELFRKSVIGHESIPVAKHANYNSQIA